jgi:TonB family protein
MVTAGNAEESLKRPLACSIGLHALLASAVLFSLFSARRGESWGGPGGGAISVGLTASVPGVPLPRPEAVTTSRVVDETKGLYKSDPVKPEIPADAVPLKPFEKNKPPKYVTKPSRLLEDPSKPPPNAVPYGGGGAPAVPYSAFTLGAGTQGGLGFSGEGGGGFGARFPWYVQAVQRRISSNWLQSSVDPSVRWAPRIEINFEISSEGTVGAIQVIKSSGNSSVDTSAVRAIRDSSPLDRLPPGYAGRYVNVDFWFDFHR